MYLYAGQLALNFAFMPLFFGAKAMRLALVDLTALIGVTFATIAEFRKVDPTAAHVMWPYLAWLLYEASLNLYYVLNNKPGQVVAVGVPVAAGFATGYALKADFESVWYNSLIKPSWAPPKKIVGPVWLSLYAILGYASWRVGQAGGGKVPLGLYSTQLLLNFAWSPIFFKYKLLDASAVDLAALYGLTVATLIGFAKVDGVAAGLVTPYLGWLTYVSAVYGEIILKNRPKKANPKAEEAKEE